MSTGGVQIEPIRFDKYDKTNKKQNNLIVESALKDLIRSIVNKKDIPEADLASKMNEVSNMIGVLADSTGNTSSGLDLREYSIRYNLQQYYKLLDDNTKYISREYSYIVYEKDKYENVEIEWGDNLNNHILTNNNKVRGCIISTNTIIKLYVIGDLEGNITLLYNWLITKNFIDDKLNWTYTEKPGELTLIVQCGDQIDTGGRSEYKDREIDLALLLFMDYLNVVSSGKVLSIIGNHEWFNIIKDYRYAPRKPIKEDESKLLFEQKNILGRIINRRNFIIRIDKYLFAHGGITSIELNIYDSIINNTDLILTKNKINIDNYLKKYTNTSFDINKFIYIINNQLFIENNWDSNWENNTNMFNYVINPHGNAGNIGVVFSRYLYPKIVSGGGTELDDILSLIKDLDDDNDFKYNQLLKNSINDNNKILLPEVLREFTIITGHNTLDKMKLIYADKSDNIVLLTEEPDDDINKIDDGNNKIINIFTDVKTRRLENRSETSISLYVLNIDNTQPSRTFKSEYFTCDINDDSIKGENNKLTTPYKNKCYIMNALVYLKKYLAQKSQLNSGTATP